MLNTVALIGRLVADPEIRYTPSGVPVANFRTCPVKSCEAGVPRNRFGTISQGKPSTNTCLRRGFGRQAGPARTGKSRKGLPCWGTLTGTHWFSCIAWKSLAEVVEKYLSKGSQVGLSGSIRQRTWQTDAGETRSTVEIVVRNLTLLDGRKKEDAPAVADDDIPF